MFAVRNFLDNDDIEVIEDYKGFKVLEYKKDLSVDPTTAMIAYFCSEMNIRKRQVVCEMDELGGGCVLQAGAMQWTVGDVNATTGIKGAGDFFSKAVRGSVTGESAIKPEYKGTGFITLEPTFKYPIVMDLAEWGGSVVLDDGIFLACDSDIRHKAVMRSNFSSAVAGGEGLFNLSLNGNGLFVIESPVPRQELVVIDLRDDQLKIDGNNAIAWSTSLDFTVERSGKSLIGSAASGEGLVNVYRGTGRIMMAPVE